MNYQINSFYHSKLGALKQRRKNAGAPKYRKVGWIPFNNVPMHVMGWRQCLFLERMISENPVVTAMVNNVNAFVKTAQTIFLQLAIRLTKKAIVCTNTVNLVSSYSKSIS